MAEALALDIPPKRRGPTPPAEQSVPDQLEGARQAIIDAGGEDFSIATLSDHRLTALWAAGEGGTFRWVEGVSFTAHNLARSMGMPFEDFAAMPASERSINALRGTMGASPEPEPASEPAAAIPRAGRNGQAPAIPQPLSRAPAREELPAAWAALAGLAEEFARDVTKMLPQAEGAPPEADRARLAAAVGAAMEALQALNFLLEVPSSA